MFVFSSTSAPPDRAVPGHPALGQRRGDRADHLYDDDGKTDADRHAEADRRVQLAAGKVFYRMREVL